MDWIALRCCCFLKAVKAEAPGKKLKNGVEGVVTLCSGDGIREGKQAISGKQGHGCQESQNERILKGLSHAFHGVYRHFLGRDKTGSGVR